MMDKESKGFAYLRQNFSKTSGVVAQMKQLFDHQ
jgi:hypothetical protein